MRFEPLSLACVGVKRRRYYEFIAFGLNEQPSVSSRSGIRLSVVALPAEDS